ncbi:hypothetical protein SAMN05877753_105265 [Bacillus oleivorans]|uniref:Uncharacterized protein n=1 Tax=Bacillus oleivorans TaxID=1448271 RepID=A0A285CV78_9BACI|nr:hypothetical protein SAMN05877753_105265 [Bacillus oleivorans]
MLTYRSEAHAPGARQLPKFKVYTILSKNKSFGSHKPRSFLSLAPKHFPFSKALSPEVQYVHLNADQQMPDQILPLNGTQELF